MNLAAGTAVTAVTAGQINPQMNLALSVAENVMGGRSPTLRCVTISHLSQADECQAARGGKGDLQEEEDN